MLYGPCAIWNSSSHMHIPHAPGAPHSACTYVPIPLRLCQAVHIYIFCASTRQHLACVQYIQDRAEYKWRELRGGIFAALAIVAGKATSEEREAAMEEAQVQPWHQLCMDDGARPACIVGSSGAAHGHGAAESC